MPFAMKAMKASDSASGATDSEHHHEVWLRGQGQCSSGDGSSLPWCPQTSMHNETERDSVKRTPDYWHDPMSKDEAWQEATPLKKKKIKPKLDMQPKGYLAMIKYSNDSYNEDKKVVQKAEATKPKQEQQQPLEDKKVAPEDDPIGAAEDDQNMQQQQQQQQQQKQENSRQIAALISANLEMTNQIAALSELVQSALPKLNKI